MDKTKASLRDALLSAIVLALANMGDAFLYAYMPSNHQQLGISAFWAGVILAVNRFARLFLNGWVAWVISRRGIRSFLLIAALLASFTTASYGWMNAIPIWIFIRVVWGFCFSALRLCNTLYALQHPHKGIAIGLSRSMIEIGPVLALMLGPYLLQYGGREFTFLVFSLLSLAGILLVIPMRDIKVENVSKRDLILSFPSSYNLLVLIHAFITEGVMVVLLVRMITDEKSVAISSSLALVGLLLGFRRLSLVVFSSLSGWLADRWGFHKVFVYTTIFVVVGLLIMLSGERIVGIIIIFTFSAMNTSIATGGAIGMHRSIIKKVSDNATWRDIGTATGAFVGALLLSFSDMRMLLMLCIIFFALGLVYHHRRHATFT